MAESPPRSAYWGAPALLVLGTGASAVAGASAAAFSGLLVLLGYVILDLYLSGHNLARRSPAEGDPWYQSVAGVLLVVVPIVVGVMVYRQWRGR